MSIINENIAQNSPATATVVNFGVSFLHLNVTEKIENPIEDKIPNRKPSKEPLSKSPLAIIAIPNVATIIEVQTFVEIASFKNKKPN